MIKRQQFGNKAATQTELGFTLIEVLMALTVFALIAALSYSTLDMAGTGFNILSKVRTAQEQSGWVGKTLRQDLRYLSAAPQDTSDQKGKLAAGDKIVPIRIQNDNRGDVEFDQLWLLVRLPGTQSISQVHYYIDEDNNHLMRESRLLLARDNVTPLHWDFGKIHSWVVEVWDKDGNQRQDWNFDARSFSWPKAVDVHLQVDGSGSIASQRHWLMSVFPEQLL